VAGPLDGAEHAVRRSRYVVRMVNSPHPLPWFVGTIVVVGLVAALVVDARDPTWALRSE
jgi:hypothetical protein